MPKLLVTIFHFLLYYVSSDLKQETFIFFAVENEDNLRDNASNGHVVFLIQIKNVS